MPRYEAITAGKIKSRRRDSGDRGVEPLLKLGLTRNSILPNSKVAICTGASVSCSPTRCRPQVNVRLGGSE